MIFLEQMLIFKPVPAAGASLEDAQLAKLDALIAAAGISAGDTVLEIGCGWGSCAIRAVQASEIAPSFPHLLWNTGWP